MIEINTPMPEDAQPDLASRIQPEDKIMSRERIEGAAQKAVGAAKQTIGKAIGSDKLQVEGLTDKVVGSAKEAVGKAKDTLHKVTR